MLPSESLLPLRGLDVEIVEGDVRDIRSLLNAFDGAKTVYHLASMIALSPSQSHNVNEVNVRGTHNVVEACLQCGVKRLVYTSSIHAMSEPPEGTVFTEDRPFDPEIRDSVYGRSKALASLEVLKGVDRGLDAVIVCPTGVIGPYDFKPSETGKVMLDFGRRRLFASVDGAYDFVDVRDAVAGHIAAQKKGETGEKYILSGERVTVFELIKTLSEATGLPAPRIQIPAWAAEAGAACLALYCSLTNAKPWFTVESIRTLQSNSSISSEKAARSLGYSSRPVREAIFDAVRWFRETGMLQL